jgi:hypothetical protein
MRALPAGVRLHAPGLAQWQKLGTNLFAARHHVSHIQS